MDRAKVILTLAALGGGIALAVVLAKRAKAVPEVGETAWCKIVIPETEGWGDIGWDYLTLLEKNDVYTVRDSSGNTFELKSLYCHEESEEELRQAVAEERVPAWFTAAQRHLEWLSNMGYPPGSELYEGYKAWKQNKYEQIASRINGRLEWSPVRGFYVALS